MIEKEIVQNIDLLKILMRYLHDDSYHEPHNLLYAITKLKLSIKMLKQDNHYETIKNILIARHSINKILQTCDDRGNCYNRMKKSHQELRKLCDDISIDITSNLMYNKKYMTD